MPELFWIFHNSFKSNSTHTSYVSKNKDNLQKFHQKIHFIYIVTSYYFYRSMVIILKFAFHPPALPLIQTSTDARNASMNMPKENMQNKLVQCLWLPVTRWNEFSFLSFRLSLVHFIYSSERVLWDVSSTAFFAFSTGFILTFSPYVSLLSRFL